VASEFVGGAIFARCPKSDIDKLVAGTEPEVRRREPAATAGGDHA
jgi:hypothetical protein